MQANRRIIVFVLSGLLFSQTIFAQESTSTTEAAPSHRESVVLETTDETNSTTRSLTSQMVHQVKPAFEATAELAGESTQAVGQGADQAVGEIQDAGETVFGKTVRFLDKKLRSFFSWFN